MQQNIYTKLNLKCNEQIKSSNK